MLQWLKSGQWTGKVGFMYVSGGSFADHWIDLVLSALLAAFGWLIVDRIRAMDSRHQRAEDKFEEVDKEITDFRERLASVETICNIRTNKSHGILPK